MKQNNNEHSWVKFRTGTLQYCCIVMCVLSLASNKWESLFWSLCLCKSILPFFFGSFIYICNLKNILLSFVVWTLLKCYHSQYVLFQLVFVIQLCNSLMLLHVNVVHSYSLLYNFCETIQKCINALLMNFCVLPFVKIMM